MGCIVSLLSDPVPSEDEVRDRLAKALDEDLGTGFYECGQLADALVRRDGVRKMAKLLKNHKHFSPVLRPA